MENKKIIEYLQNNVETLADMVRDCNGWDGSLEWYEYYENDEEFFYMFFEGKPMEAVRASYYGKAIIEQTTNKNVEDFKLYSYGTLVARLTRIGNKSIYHCFGKYSCTTTRHQKEFFKQNGLNDKGIKELFDKGVLEIEL